MRPLSALTSLASQLSDRELRTIRRAARAEHAYFAMLRGSDDQRRRIAMMQYRVDVDAELRGDVSTAPVSDLSVPLEVAVERELVAMTPRVRMELVMRRQTRRLASDCGPVQLAVSANGSARRKLRMIRRQSQLCMREIAQALGIAERTLERHVGGEKINGERRQWYAQLESIDVEGDYYRILVRRCAPTRKRWGWLLTREEKRQLIAGQA
jgi:hypothetical protein